MNRHNNSVKTVASTMFRLLPLQIFLAASNSSNTIISSFFATNYVGIDTMSAIGLATPFFSLLTAISVIICNGSVILAGRFWGQNDYKKLQTIFSTSFVISIIFSALVILSLIILTAFDLTSFFTKDEPVRKILNTYLLGHCIGIFPLLAGNQLVSFISMESRGHRTIIASFLFILSNIFFCFLFVKVLHLEAFGLALASGISSWIFFIIHLFYYLLNKSFLKISTKKANLKISLELLKEGFPAALFRGYVTICEFSLNKILLNSVGIVAVSAYAVTYNIINIFWIIFTGMHSVSRIMISISIGEENRTQLTDIMRVTIRYFAPILLAVAAFISLNAIPLAKLFYPDTAEQAYKMTISGLRLMPFFLPFFIIYSNYQFYAQMMKKQICVHLISFLDGFLFLVVFTALLAPFIGSNSVFIAYILDGVLCFLFLFVYSIAVRKKIPKNMSEFMVVPLDFGVTKENRINIIIKNMDEVVNIARQVQPFCLERGIDNRRAFLSALVLEEMAGNIIDHGFNKDNKKHFVDIGVVIKNDNVILRLKDDCVPFDPKARRKMIDDSDITKNIGLRIVFNSAKDIQYQNILGLNNLMIRI